MRGLLLLSMAGCLVACSTPPPSGCDTPGGHWRDGEGTNDFVSCQTCTCRDGHVVCVPLEGCAAEDGYGGGPGRPLPPSSSDAGVVAGGPDGPGVPDAAPPPVPDRPMCATGSVRGLACAPDGSAIAGARVWADTVDCQGQPRHVEVIAGAAGTFQLDGLAPGPLAVFVQAGRFERRYDVTVVAGQSVPVDVDEQTACLGRDTVSIAVTTGEYDDVQSIISRLGFDHDVYCGDSRGDYGARALLGDWTRLSRYDVVFINCGLTVDFATPEGRTMVANLQRFVAGGGSLYISDLAANVVQAAWPDEVRFDADRDPPFADDPCCTCIACPAQCGAQADAPRRGGECLGTTAADRACERDTVLYGYGGPGVRDARVVSADLQRFLGRDRLAVSYDLEGWVEIQAVAPDVQTLVQSGGEPLMVLFTVPGGGRVAYTTFHNESQAAADVEQILRALVFQL